MNSTTTAEFSEVLSTTIASETNTTGTSCANGSYSEAYSKTEKTLIVTASCLTRYDSIKCMTHQLGRDSVC